MTVTLLRFTDKWAKIC